MKIAHGAVFPLVLTLAFASACGSKSSSSTTGPSSISALPKVTDSVAGGSSMFDGSTHARATTGVPLSSMSTSAGASNGVWPSGKSRAACETMTAVRDLFNQAALADQMVCTIGVLEKYGILPNVYDGADHYYQFGTIPFKISASKSGGVVNSFKLYLCTSPTGTQNNIYVNESISAGAVSSTVAVSFGAGPMTAALRAVATGNINASNQWTSKTVTSNASLAVTGASGGSYTASAVLTQGASTVSLSSYRSASFGGTSATASAYAVVQTINPGSMATFALGDGSAKATFTYANQTVNANANAAISWDGDTLVNLTNASAGDNYAAANAGTLPTGVSGSSAMQAGETWNCAAVGGFSSFGQATGDGSAELANCQSQYQAFGDSADIDCHNGS